MDDIVLTHATLDVGKISSSVTDTNTGATSIFVGTTRDNFAGKVVVRLEYEAYEQMAAKEMAKLCSELRRRWPGIHRIAVHHRLGVVDVKEASVVIAVSSPHRKESLEAVHFAIDKLKETVPIWKKEIYLDGEDEWKQNKECKWSGDRGMASCNGNGK